MLSGEKMKENLKVSARLFLKLVIVNLMCAIIVLSVNVLATGLFSKEVGYTAIGVTEGSQETETLYTHRFEDGEDTERAKYEAKGYEITDFPLKELDKKIQKGATVFSQFLCIVFLSTFIYPMIWQLGFNDSNKVKFKHKTADKLTGIKIGLIAIIPAIALIIFLACAKGVVQNLPLALYKFVNGALYGFIDLADGNAMVFGDLNILNFVFMAAVQLIVPLIAHFSYILGFKNISVGEMLVYKKKKEK